MYYFLALSLDIKYKNNLRKQLSTPKDENAMTSTETLHTPNSQ